MEELTQNMLIAAKYQSDWYRAKVLDVTDKYAEVFYFDYGNIEKVSFSDVMPLHESLRDHPSCSIKCKLRYFDPTKCDKEPNQTLKSYTYNESELYVYVAGIEHDDNHIEPCKLYLIDLFCPVGSKRQSCNVLRAMYDKTPSQEE